MSNDGQTNPTRLPTPPDGWRVMQIEKLCTRVTSGGTPSRKRPEFYQNGTFNWFKTKELKDCTLYESEEKITQQALDSSSAKLFPPDTVLMAMYGDGITITSLGILRQQAATNQACCAMIPDRAVCEPRFLFYSLLFHRADFLRIATGGAQRNLSGTLIRKFALNTPLLDEQKAISSVLGTLDDKIELNGRTSRTFERLARAIFRAWFVDFEPVRAKADGARSFTGMPQDAFDALPSRFFDSDLGQIPEGWTVESIGNVVTVKGGGTPSTKVNEYWEGGVHCWLTPKDLSGMKDSVLLSTDRKITDSGLDQISSGLLPVSTVLLSSRAPVGYLVIAGVPTAINQGFIAMVCNGPLPPLYVYHWTQSVMDQIKSRASGTTFPEISKSAFRPIKVCIPQDDVLKAFNALVEPLFEKITANIKETRSLERMRDYLLSKLLSGEVRVRSEQSPDSNVA